MRSLLIFLLFILASQAGWSQQAAAVDSMKLGLAEAKTPEEKIYMLDLLSRTLMNVNQKESDKYGQEMISYAEETRDRRLMVKAYISNGQRCGYLVAVSDYLNRSLEYFNKALSIAKQNKFDDDIGVVLMNLASVNLNIPDKDKALNYANQAFSTISTLPNDSLKSEAHGLYGHVYLSRNDKILALRNYLLAMRIAEKVDKPGLLRRNYLNLSGFYSSIEDYDRAIDYYMQAFKKLDEMTDRNIPYQRAIDLNSIGKLYGNKKNFDIAVDYFQKSIKLADDLKFSTLKVPAYLSILNQYLALDQPEKALEYFNSPDGQNLKTYLNSFGFTGAIDQAYGFIYTQLNQLDSAKIYFAKAVPFYEKNPSEIAKLNHYAQVAAMYDKGGENQKAIDLYLKVKAISEKVGSLEGVEKSAKHLDTLYTRLGNYKEASIYNSLYYKMKDSIQTLNKEKELTQVEATDEQLRQERLAVEAAEKKNRKNNIQYTAITIGIICVFVLLVVLGMFRIPVTVIRALGFFAFLLVFEFIFLVFKKNITALTQGEPWKDLAFMIGLAALLVPLHHWMEHRVIHYLTSHNRLTATGESLLARFRKRKNS